MADAGKGDSQSATVRVEVIHPERKDIRQTVAKHAQIRPFEETPLFARTPGYVRRVAVDIGDRVAGPKLDGDGKPIGPGQVLLELSIPEVQEQVEQKAALVAQAQADVQQAGAGVQLAQASLATATAKALESEAAIERTKSSFEKWRSEHQRIVELASKSAVNAKVVDETRDQLNAAQAAQREAEAKRHSAQAAIQESKAGLEKAKADLAAKQAHVRVAEAYHHEAQTMLEYGTLRAPFDGIVTSRNVDTGHLVQIGAQREPLLVVARVDVLRMSIDVPEGDADLADVDDPVSIRIPAASNELIIESKIARTSGSLHPESRTLRVEFDVPNADGRLRPGMYAFGTVLLAEKSNAMVLPTSAVFSDNKRLVCACVEDGKIVRKQIDTGLKSGSEIEITAGLAGAEQVVRANAAGLAEGQRVEAVPYNPPKP